MKIIGYEFERARKDIWNYSEGEGERKLFDYIIVLKIKRSNLLKWKMTEIGKLINFNNLPKKHRYDSRLLSCITSLNPILLFTSSSSVTCKKLQEHQKLVLSTLFNDTPLQRNLKKKERKFQTK